jgi:hypothetical protein
MTLAVQNECMFPIAYAVSHNQMRRSLVGALATDPVVPERRQRTRRPTRAHATHVTRALAPARSSARAPTGPSRHTRHANEGAQTA